MADHTAVESTAASIIERATVIQMRIHGQTNRYARLVYHLFHIGFPYLTEYNVDYSSFSFSYWYYILKIFRYLFVLQTFYLCSIGDNFSFFFLIPKSIHNLYTFFENIFYIICTDTFISGVITIHVCFFYWIVLLNFFTSLLLYYFFIFLFLLCRRTDWRWKMCMYKWFIKSNFYLLW